MSTSATTSAASPLHLRIDGVSKSFRSRRVLTNVSFVVSSGQRIGLIGENGSGKSTLLMIAAGVIDADAGSVDASGSTGLPARIGLLHQEHAFDAVATVSSALDAFVAPVRHALEQLDVAAMEFASAPHDQAASSAYGEALERAERLNAWELDSQIASMLAGMGLGNLPGDRLVSALSGGQRARLALAGLLLSAPDVLLLDEPTNHLDDAATEHLRRVLAAWRGPVLMASHDRAFLDETATGLVDLDPAPTLQQAATLDEDDRSSGLGSVQFTGSYTDYLVSQADARTRWELRFRDEQAELKRLRASVQGEQHVGHHDWKPRTEVRGAQKFYADRNAKVVARRVNDARSRLERLEAAQVRKPPAELQFAGLSAGSSGQPVSNEQASVSAVEVALDGRLRPTSFVIKGGEKLLITGANGAGKSTLLNIIAGMLAPGAGQVDFAPSARVGILTQEVDLPDPFERGATRTVQQAYVDLVGAARAAQTPLSTFELIAARDEQRAVLTLSLGQQRRLELAVLLADPPNVLLLDEPTNHLSLRLATQLEAAIVDYPGTVIVASHDRWLRTRWAGSHLALTT